MSFNFINLEEENLCVVKVINIIKNTTFVLVVDKKMQKRTIRNVLIVSCGKRPAADNKILCKHCAARINYRNRQKYLLNIYATKNICEISI